MRLQDDPDVILFGEDVGIDGGVFRATDGLIQRFGSSRVRDTPLSETVIAGMAVGAAAHGLKPVAEIQFMGFLYSAIDQLANHAARLRNRTRGRLSCPMVLRAPFGGGIKAPEHHSESMEAMLAHIPGLRVVIPSSPARAYGLLLAAIRDPDPVVFLEPKRLYRSVSEAMQDDGQALPIDKAVLLREGGGRHPRQLGGDAGRDRRRCRSAGHRGHFGGGDRPVLAEAYRPGDDPRIGRKNRVAA